MKVVRVALLALAIGACTGSPRIPDNCEIRYEGVCYQQAAPACAAAGCPDNCTILESYPGQVQCMEPAADADTPATEQPREPAPPAASGETLVRLLQYPRHCGGMAPSPEEEQPYDLGVSVDVAPASLSGNRLVVDEAAAVNTHTNRRITLPGDGPLFGMRTMSGGWMLAEVVDGVLLATRQSEPCSWQREECTLPNGRPCPLPS